MRLGQGSLIVAAAEVLTSLYAELTPVSLRGIEMQDTKVGLSELVEVLIDIRDQLVEANKNLKMIATMPYLQEIVKAIKEGPEK
ncbi:MAG: hypothetical protein KAW84_05125 [Thermoplasmata archaeon]|nr:hypothetical protein [Thermoplasmata archaeon]